MELIVSRGKLNGDPQKYPVIEKGVSLAMGSSYVRNAFQGRLGPGETMDSSMNAYDQYTKEVPAGYEPHMDIYVMWCNSLVRDSKHPRGRVYFARDGVKYLFAGGQNSYTIYEVEK